jgi:hypothetical protein
MSTINKGDLVRCIDSAATLGLLRRGQLYTVQLVTNDPTGIGARVMVGNVNAYIDASRLQHYAAPVKGGKRPGSGRKPKFGGPSKVITVRVPADQAGVIRARIQGILQEYS